MAKYTLALAQGWPGIPYAVAGALADNWTQTSLDGGLAQFDDTGTAEVTSDLDIYPGPYLPGFTMFCSRAGQRCPSLWLTDGVPAGGGDPAAYVYSTPKGSLWANSVPPFPGIYVPSVPAAGKGVAICNTRMPSPAYVIYMPFLALSQGLDMFGIISGIGFWWGETTAAVVFRARDSRNFWYAGAVTTPFSPPSGPPTTNTFTAAEWGYFSTQVFVLGKIVNGVRTEVYRGVWKPKSFSNETLPLFGVRTRPGRVDIGYFTAAGAGIVVATFPDADLGHECGVGYYAENPVLPTNYVLYNIARKYNGAGTPVYWWIGPHIGEDIVTWTAGTTPWAFMQFFTIAFTWQPGRRRPVYPLIDNSLVPHVAVNHPAPASGTDAFNQDDQGRLNPALRVSRLGRVALIGTMPSTAGGFGSFGSFD